MSAETRTPNEIAWAEYDAGVAAEGVAAKVYQAAKITYHEAARWTSHLASAAVATGDRPVKP